MFSANVAVHTKGFVPAKCLVILFFNKNVVLPAQAKYFYFSADSRLKILLYYS